MKHFLLSLILGISFTFNISYCASASDADEESGFGLVSFAFAAVNTYEKFSNLVSMLDNIDSLADKAKLIEISQRIKTLKLELKSATKKEIEKIKQEINSLKLFYLTAINPELIVNALIKAKLLKEDTSKWLVILLKALNSCRLGEKEKLFLILGLNPDATIEMLKGDPLRRIIPIALPILEFLANPDAIPEAIKNEATIQALEKYSSLMQQEAQAREMSSQIANLNENLQLLNSTILEKSTEYKVYEDTLYSIDSFISKLRNKNAALEETELNIDDQRKELYDEIALLQKQHEEQSAQTGESTAELKAQIEEISKTFTLELQANGLNPQNYKDAKKRVEQWKSNYDAAVNSNIVNFVIQQLGESILLKSKDTKALLEKVPSETQKLLKNKNASILLPWTMLFTEKDFLAALDIKTIMRLHNIIFGSEVELENPMCTVVDSLMPEKYSKARKALFANEASRIDAQLSQEKTLVNIYKGFSRMATYVPTLIYNANTTHQVFNDLTIQGQYIKLLDLING